MKTPVCLLLFGALFGAPFAGSMNATELSAAKRVLVISAPDAAHPAYREQAVALLPEWSGLIERDFVIESRFGAPAFAVVLIGKDGGEKLRRSAPLATDELFAVVDAMPMCRAEMRLRSAEKP